MLPKCFLPKMLCHGCFAEIVHKASMALSVISPQPLGIGEKGQGITANVWALRLLILWGRCGYRKKRSLGKT